MNRTARWIWEHPEWPTFKWNKDLLAEPLGQARKAQGRLQMVRDILDPGLAKEALASLLKAEGLSTSAIEGQHLNPASVADSVARRLKMASPSSNAPLSLEADGLVSVLMDAVESYSVPLTRERLIQWQKALLESSQPSFHPVVVGDFRPGEVFVQSGAFGQEITHFQAVPKRLLDDNLHEFKNWFNHSLGEMDGLLRAGLAHLWFITLHPFEDGNGRLARALTDHALAQDEGSALLLYRMSSRILEIKGDYYRALQQAQSIESEMNATPWLLWFIQQFEIACQHSEKTIRQTLAKAKFWARHREDPIHDRQRKVLNKLLDAGPGGFEGGLTNRKYVQMTQVAQATAFRDIEELLALGCLIKCEGGGRSTSYDIQWEELLG